jgi:hypothetical protein
MAVLAGRAILAGTFVLELVEGIVPQIKMDDAPI